MIWIHSQSVMCTGDEQFVEACLLLSSWELDQESLSSGDQFHDWVFPQSRWAETFNTA